MTLESVSQVALTDEQQDRVTEEWQEVFDRAYQSLTIAGFEPNQSLAAVDIPEITPADYVNIEGEEYTRLMGGVDYWFSRAKEKLGWVEAELICREGEHKDVVRGLKNALREEAKKITRKSDRPTETDIKEQAESYPYPRELSMRITELRAMEAVLKGRIEGLERFARGLSRQVTLREQEINLNSSSERRGRGHPGRFNS